MRQQKGGELPSNLKEGSLFEEAIKGYQGGGAMPRPVFKFFIFSGKEKKDGGQRPVINLKGLNQHIPYVHFKMEGLHLLKEIVQKGDLLCKGRILCSASPSGIPKICQIQMDPVGMKRFKNVFISLLFGYERS